MQFFCCCCCFLFFSSCHVEVELRTVHAGQRTQSPAGEGEDDDVVVGPRVVLVRRVEGQLLHALLPQVQQQGGVHHGHRVAAPLVAVAGGEVLGRAAVVALRDGRGEAKALTFKGHIYCWCSNLSGHSRSPCTMRAQRCRPSLTASCCCQRWTHR